MKYSGYDVFILSRDVYVRSGFYHLCLEWHLSNVFVFDKTIRMEAAIYRSLLFQNDSKRRVVIISFECGDDGPEETINLLERLKKFKDSVELFLFMPLSACRFKSIYRSCNSYIRFCCEKESVQGLRNTLNEPPASDVTEDAVMSFTDKEKSVFFKFLENPRLPCKDRKAYMSDYVVLTQIARKFGMTSHELRECLYQLNFEFIMKN